MERESLPDFKSRILIFLTQVRDKLFGAFLNFLERAENYEGQDDYEILHAEADRLLGEIDRLEEEFKQSNNPAAFDFMVLDTAVEDIVGKLNAYKNESAGSITKPN